MFEIMALVIGIVSQKGGVGKSTLSRLLACEYANNQWDVKIADMDLSQGTCTHWHRRRLDNEYQPSVSVEQFSKVSDALKRADYFDLLIFDGAPHSSSKTLDIAKESEIVILPTGVSLDDLEPTIRLAHELKQKGVSTKKVAIALCKVGESTVEVEEAKDYIALSGYFLLEGEMRNKTAIRRASDMGKSPSETPYKSINQGLDILVNSIVNRIKVLQKG